MAPAFKLSAQLLGHESDVRAVCFASPDTILSASRDCSVRTWCRSSIPDSTSPTFEPHVAAKGSDYINSITYLPPTEAYPEGLIVSGGKDTIIEVRKPTASPDDNAERLLIGHAHNVCALDVTPDGKRIVSGGWDAQARVWGVGSWETECVLAGHEAGVWAVLAVDGNTVLTGCADKNIRIFDLAKSNGGEVQPRSTIYTPDIVRALCLVPKNHPSGADFASAHNDGTLRLWKFSGQMLAELEGHESFVYGLAALPSGEMVSCAEDRTVRVWRGQECVQVITHPAISVWCVAACPRTGDIVTGASDGAGRVFTRDDGRVADAETLAEFEASVKASAIPQQQVGGVNKEKLPGPEFLTSRSGTKEGQVQMIKEENGSVSAYTWSMGSQSWVNVGTVVDSASSTGRRVDHEGKSYDYVFDVDIEDGKPPLKLPYNLSENPYERARKFLEDNELPISYLDNVVRFIEENTKGATLGSGSEQQGDTYAATRGEERKSRVLPQTEFLSILAAKHEAIVNKILTVNDTMISAGRKDAALNPTDQSNLKELRYTLQSGKPVDATGLELILRIATRWDYAERLPGLDLLRCVTGTPLVAAHRDVTGRSIVQILIESATAAGEGQQVNVNCVLMALRGVANLFSSPQGRDVAAAEVERVLGLVERVVGISGGSTEGIGRYNRNVLVALTTVLLDYAVLARKKGASSAAASHGAAEARRRFVRVADRVVGEASDAEVVFRGLVGLGTWLYGGVGGAGVDREAVREALERVGEERVRGVGGEVLALLR